MAVELAARREKDLEAAKNLLEKKEKAKVRNNGAIGREKNFAEWKEKRQEELAGAEPMILRPTVTYEKSKITPQQLHVQQERRSKAGAHSRAVASGGYDLNRGGRSVPSWTQGANL